jgi:hypothetical protein
VVAVSGFTRQLDGPNHRAVVIEDDARVCYAYLLHGDELVGDVWLYNVHPTPTERPWDIEGAEPPFLNPAEFTAPTRLTLSAESPLRCDWTEDAARVYLGTQLIAILRDGASPGWSATAASDGPLAKVLTTGRG